MLNLNVLKPSALGLFIFFVGVSCSDDSGKLEEGSLSANRLIQVPATANENAIEGEVGAVPVMSFDSEMFDFGEIETGEVVEHVYMFTNTGEAPLIITSANASCGCTVPQWPKEPIEPNGSGEIKVRFDSKGKSGVQNKTVTVIANTQPSQTQLTLKGNVKNPVKKDENS